MISDKIHIVDAIRSMKDIIESIDPDFLQKKKAAICFVLEDRGDGYLRCDGATLGEDDLASGESFKKVEALVMDALENERMVNIYDS